MNSRSARHMTTTEQDNDTSTRKARAGAVMTPSFCLDGASHGWVPVNTHHEHCKRIQMSPDQNGFNVVAELTFQTHGTEHGATGETTDNTGPEWLGSITDRALLVDR